MSAYEIPAAELKKYIDPRDGELWKCGVISQEDINEAVSRGVVEDRSWDGDGLVNNLPLDEAREFHINRIATLLSEPTDDLIVLVAELHNPEDIRVYVYDGNHRLSAAYHRGDVMVAVNIATSEESDISTYFPGAKQV